MQEVDFSLTLGKGCMGWSKELGRQRGMEGKVECGAECECRVCAVGMYCLWYL